MISLAVTAVWILNSAGSQPITNELPEINAMQVIHRSGRVTRVIDGDTIVVAGVGRVRLIGVNAPERRQRGHREATNFMRRMVLNRHVSLQIDARRPRDRFGRTRAVVFVENMNVNDELVRRGHARRV